MGSGRVRFLSVTAEHFAETGEWPSLDEVQTLLARNRDLSNVRRRAKRLPRTLGKRDRGVVVLSVRGIHLADPNEPLLGSFLAALIWASRGYLGKEGRKQSSFSERELVENVGLSAARAEQVVALLISEGLVSPAKPHSPEQRLSITSRIVPYLYVSDLSDYLRTRKRQDCRRRFKRILTLPGRLATWFRSKDTSVVAKIVATTLAMTIAGILLAIVLGSSGSAGVPGGSSPATPREDPGSSRH